MGEPRLDHRRGPRRPPPSLPQEQIAPASPALEGGGYSHTLRGGSEGGYAPLLAILVITLLSVGLAIPAGAQSSSVILATTTSTQDSGLLDVLVPLFEKHSGYRVKTVAVGTGNALKLGADGNADVVLVHAPDLEREYVRAGTLIDRRRVMYNDFVLVGPPADPARVRTLKLAIAAIAMKQIAEARAPFVSRGDNSGTHIRERALWKDAGVAPRDDWYIESGQGMGATLVIASEKRAYTLTDRSTFLALAKRVDLTIVLDGDPTLQNVYHVMRPNPEQMPRVNVAGGKAFADFLVSPAAQAVIRTFGVDLYGQPLFFPDAGTSG